MSEEDDFGPYSDLVDDSRASVLHGVRIACYLDSEGQKSYALQHEGTADAATFLGLLEWGKAVIHEQARVQGTLLPPDSEDD